MTPTTPDGSPATELRQLLARITSELEARPDEALRLTFRSALWILQQLNRRHLEEVPAEADYSTLLDALLPHLPRRIVAQFRAVDGFASFDEAGDDEAPLSSAEILPCLQALDNLVQWYQKDVLGGERSIAFMPEPSSTSNEQPAASDPTVYDSDVRRLTEASHPSGWTQRLVPTQITVRSRFTRGLQRILPILGPTLVVLVFLMQMWEAQNAASKLLGLSTNADSQQTVVTSVRPGGPMDRAGILSDDILLQIGRFPLLTRADYLDALQTLERGQMVTLRVERDGITQRFEVVPGVAVDWQKIVVRGFVVLCCLILSIMTFQRRGGGVRGQLLSSFLWLIALEMALPLQPIRTVWVYALTTVLYYLITGAQASVNFHIASVVPERQPWIARRPWVIKLYYTLGIGFGMIAALTFLLEDLPGFAWLPLPGFVLDDAVNLVILPLWAAGVIFLLGGAALRHPNRSGRAQAQIVLVGMLPWSVYVFATTAYTLLDQSSPNWLDEIFPAIALCFPASIWAIIELENRHQERTLSGLVHQIRQVRSIDEILLSIGIALDHAFHPIVVYVFFRRRPQDDLTLGHSSNSDPPSSEIPARFEMLNLLASVSRVQVFPDDLAPRLSDEENHWLARLSSHLVVPISNSDEELVGVVILGSKRSEENYTGLEKKQMVSVAGQIALAFENIGLQNQLNERNRVQREVLDRLGDRQINLVKECEICGRCFDHDVEHCEFDRSQLVLSVPVERTISERYRLDRVIGKGGIGSVYEATDLRLNRRVAVKVLLGSVIDNPMIKKRFEQEARIVAKLSHPNIVTLYDCGQTTVGNAFIVLELLEGFTLRTALKRHGRIPYQTLAEWFDQILYALIAAHAEGIVHRDLKPGNVLITRGGGRKSSVKLLDFGIAKIKSSPTQRGLTVPGVVLGTHGYMAPEQLSGDEVDESADIYSVGIMVLEALTGQHPRPPRSARSNTPRKVQVSIGNSAPALALERIIRQCLKSDPLERFPSAEALRRALIPTLLAFPSSDNPESLIEIDASKAEGTEKIEITGGLEDSIKELRREMRRRQRDKRSRRD